MQASQLAANNSNQSYDQWYQDYDEAENEFADDYVNAMLMFVPVHKLFAGARYLWLAHRAGQVAKIATRTSVNDKLARYLLNKLHPVGGSKAQWFERALGFTLNNSDDIARQIIFNSKTSNWNSNKNINMLQEYTVVKSLEDINEVVKKGTIGTILMVFKDDINHYEVEFMDNAESLGVHTVSENQIINILTIPKSEE